MKNILLAAAVSLLAAQCLSPTGSIGAMGVNSTNSSHNGSSTNSSNITHGNTTSNNSTVVPTPAPTLGPITAGYAKYLRSHFDFFFVFYQSTFNDCKTSFDDYCLPALNREWYTNSPLRQSWQAQDLKCLNTYCNCWPGGHLAKRQYGNQVSYTCQIPATLTNQELCIAEEYCAAANYVCFMDWMYGVTNKSASQLPAGCSSFLRCAERPNVVENTTASCRANPPTQTVAAQLQCDMERTCKFTTSQVDDNVTVAKLTAESAAAEAALGALQHKGISSTTLHSIMLVTGLLILFGLVLFGYAYVRYRNQIQIAAAEEAAALLSGDELQAEAIQSAKWYGAPLALPTLDGAEPPALTCVFCSAPNPKFLLLGCRCRWCGCKTAAMKKMSTDGSKKKKDKKKEDEEQSPGAASDTAASGPTAVSTVPEVRPSKCDCGEKVEEIIDFSLFQEKVIVSSPTTAGEETNPESRTESAAQDGDGNPTGDGDNSCVICLDGKAIVAFFPCAHRATCGSCGKRIVEGDAVARQTQVQNYAEGKKASCQCPLCRTDIDFAVVLEVDLEEQAEIKAALDANGFCTKPLNVLVGQERQDVVQRIKDFNRKFNKDGVRKVEDLFKYHWTEDEVMRKLMAKYAPGELKNLKDTPKPPKPPQVAAPGPRDDQPPSERSAQEMDTAVVFVPSGSSATPSPPPPSAILQTAGPPPTRTTRTAEDVSPVPSPRVSSAAAARTSPVKVEGEGGEGTPHADDDDGETREEAAVLEQQASSSNEAGGRARIEGVDDSEDEGTTTPPPACDSEASTEKLAPAGEFEL